MPWSPSDAPKYNKDTEGDEHLQEIWAAAANAALEEYDDEGKAIATANAAVANEKAKRSGKPPRHKRAEAGVKLNGAGESHARSLINAGKVSDADWSFEASDGDALLGADGNDWEEYGRWFLGEDASADERTKERYKYPFGKGGQVYVAALRAIRSRASQQGETSIFDAAGRAPVVAVRWPKMSFGMSWWGGSSN